MPELVDTSHSRETVDLHAPWWPDDKTPDGRYQSRVVVYRDITAADTEWVTKRLASDVDVRRGRSTVSKEEIGSARTLYFLRVIVEMTNSAGQPYWAPDAKYEVRRHFLKMLSERDATFIWRYIDEQTSEPDVPVLDEDEDEATRNLRNEVPDEELQTPEGVAANHFRPGRAARADR